MSNWDILDGMVGEPEVETGFAQNFRVLVGQIIDEDLSISEYIHNADKRERNAALRERAKTDEDFRNQAMPHIHRGRRGTRFDYEALAELAKETDPSVMTDEELDAQVKQELDMRREYAEDVMNRADGWGVAGQAAGAITATMLDPALYPGLAFGPSGAVKAATAMRAFGGGAARVGAFTAGEEAVIQSQVMDWKERIGVEHTMSDAMLSIGLATGAGAIVGGAVGVLSRMVSGDDLANPVAKQAQERFVSGEGNAAARTLKQMEYELSNAPDPEMPTMQFAAEMDEAEAALNAPPPKPTHQLEDLSPEEDLPELDSQLAASLSDEMVIPTEDPNVMIPMRQELDELDALESRLTALQECLRAG